MLYAETNIPDQPINSSSFPIKTNDATVGPKLLFINTKVNKNIAWITTNAQECSLLRFIFAIRNIVYLYMTKT
jgi:hypothetical protein